MREYDCNVYRVPPYVSEPSVLPFDLLKERRTDVDLHDPCALSRFQHHTPVGNVGERPSVIQPELVQIIIDLYRPHAIELRDADQSSVACAFLGLRSQQVIAGGAEAIRPHVNRALEHREVDVL